MKIAIDRLDLRSPDTVLLEGCISMNALLSHAIEPAVGYGVPHAYQIQVLMFAHW